MNRIKKEAQNMSIASEVWETTWCNVRQRCREAHIKTALADWPTNHSTTD